MIRVPARRALLVPIQGRGGGGRGQGSGERRENGWCWGTSHREPGWLGSPLSQGCVRAEPKDARYQRRPMSKGRLIFKPDSFVLKYEIMLSLWPVES